MTTGSAGVVGSSPIVTVTERTLEQAKYESMWTHDAYRAVAPGEDVAQLFLSIAKPRHGSEVIDFGAGTGRGALSLALFGGLKVHMVDFAANCLDEDVRNALVTQPHALTFMLHDLTKPLTDSAEYGYCCDVMEHIPPDDVDQVLANVLKAVQHVFFQISCVDDVCGALIGQPLHLSVHPYEWWLDKFKRFDCSIEWSSDGGSYCCFYVSAWSQGKDVVAVGELNTEDTQIRANVAANILGGWQQIEPHVTNDVDLMILGGGPSMRAELETIKQLRAEGVKLITLNGAYNWAIENGLKPSAQMIVDARAFNARFTKPVIEDCKYLIASQCDPSVFDGLPVDRTYIWHTSCSLIDDLLAAQYPTYWKVPGGSTVLLRALPLLRTLGFRRFHLFGCDSCIATDAHHAYSQPENDTEIVIDTIVGGRIFKCHAWQIAQAQEFIDTVAAMGEEIELEIHGDGLLRHIVTTGAEIADSQEQ